MSAKTPTKHGGDWNGKPPAWSRKAFAQGNRAAVKHGVYVEEVQQRRACRDRGASRLAARGSGAALLQLAFEPTIRMAAARIWS